MIPMNVKQLPLFGLLLASMMVSGCDPAVRREGLGGGAISPVKVKLLTEGGSGDAAASAASAGPKITEFGTIRGRIAVDGALPQLPPIVPQGGETPDAICSEQAVPNESVVGANGGLGNVFIFLKKVPNVDIPAPPTDPLVMDQVGCVFTPHAQVVQVGRPVLLKNSDPVAHNVKLEGGSNSLTETISANNAKIVEYTFQFSDRKPTLTACNFHTFMSAYVMALDHPWAVVTNPDGTFEIPNVPATDLELVIWHEKLDYIERAYAVSVPANGEAAPVEITVSSADLSK